MPSRFSCSFKIFFTSADYKKVIYGIWSIMLIEEYLETNDIFTREKWGNVDRVG
jgi:hypothetical protein